jgi:hypothetical protein
MKHLCFLILALFFAATLFSQQINNLVVFCNDGEQFTLILNGARQNETPQTRLKVEGLNLAKYEVKIIFVNKKMKDVNTTLTFFRTGKECEFALNKYGSRKHKMEYFTEKPIDGFETQQNLQINSNQTNGNQINTNQTTPINNGFNTGQGNIAVNQNTFSTLNNNTSSINNCLNAMTNEEFLLFKNAVSNQNTDLNKHTTANSLLLNNCLTTLQVKDIIKLFTSEKARLDFAKSIYSHIKDVNNYSQLIENFITNELQNEFKNFLNGKK